MGAKTRTALKVNSSRLYIHTNKTNIGNYGGGNWSAAFELRLYSKFHNSCLLVRYKLAECSICDIWVH